MIVLGIDVGTAHTGLTYLRVESGRPVWLLGVVLEPGTTHPVDFGRLIKCAACDLGFKPDLVCVEMPFVGKRQAAKNVLAVQDLASTTVQVLRDYPVQVLRVSARDWRRALIGDRGAGRGREDGRVAEVLHKIVVGMPTKPSVHLCDAAGVAIVGERMRQTAER